MFKAILGGTTAVMIVVSSLAYAQQSATGSAGGHEHWRPSQADITAFTDARIAALKAGLQLTPDQEKSWPAVEQAMRDMARQREQRMTERRGAQHPTNAIEWMRGRADRMTARAAELKKFADASAPLYSSLNEDQKHRFVVLVRAIARHRHHFAEWRGHRGHEEGAPK
jgi:zinc resistance-associated protein